MHYRIVVASAPGWEHAGMYREVAETLMYGFRRLGHRSDIAFNTFAPDALNILMHCHQLDEAHVRQMPPDTVIFNLEQVNAGLYDWAPRLKHFLTSYEVWDYSQQNVERLQPLSRRIFMCPIGMEPEMARIDSAPLQDIDVLFYGAMNDRRQAIIDALRGHRVNVLPVFGAYGQQRDALIARSKIVLNIHHFDAQVFEIVRVSYLLANSKAVVSELSADSDIYPDLRDAIVGVPYDGIVSACRSLLRDKGKRRALERQGYKRMKARQQSSYLAELLRARQEAGMPR